MANEPDMVIGIFRDRNLAEQAVHELSKSGLSRDQVRLIGQRGDFFSSFKETLRGHPASEDNALDDPAFANLPAEQRANLTNAMEHGHSIVVAPAAERSLEIRDTMNHFGAMEVLLPSALGQERTIQLRREEMNVSKHTVVIGELRIHKRVITENKTFTIPVTREEVTIERIPIAPSQTQPSVVSASDVSARPDTYVENQTADTSVADAVLQDSGSLRILVHEEQVQFLKQNVIVEEIVVHKRVVEETRHISEPLRHEEARIERVGNVPMYGEQTDNETGSDVANLK